MGYFEMGATEYVSRSGVCKPSNWATLDIFKNMQAQLNRVAAIVGVPKIGVDGDIGNGTLYLLSNIASKMSDVSPPEVMLANEATNDCKTVATRAELIRDLAKQVGNARGAPTVATITTPHTSSGGGSTSGGGGSSGGGIVPGGTTMPLPGSSMAAGMSSAFGNLGTMEKVAIGVGVVAVAVAAGVIKVGKKRGGRSTRR